MCILLFGFAEVAEEEGSELHGRKYSLNLAII
jgi:hypothetical protein